MQLPALFRLVLRPSIPPAAIVSHPWEARNIEEEAPNAIAYCWLLFFLIPRSSDRIDQFPYYSTAA